MRNWINKLLTSGDLSYASNYDSSKIFADITDWNLVSLKSQFEQYAYSTVGDIQDFEVSHKIGDEKKITVDNCGVGDIDISVTKTPSLKFRWLDVNNLDLFAKILGLKVTSVAGTAVPSEVQTVASADWAKGVFIAFGNQNGDGSTITPTSVTGGTLTAWDYDVWTDDLGRSGITVKNTYTWSGHDIVITYAYDPNPSVLTWYKSGIDSVPFGAYRFRSCTSETIENWVNTKVRNTIYFIKFYLTSEMIETYVNRVRKDFEWSEITLTAALGGYYLKVKETWTV